MGILVRTDPAEFDQRYGPLLSCAGVPFHLKLYFIAQEYSGRGGHHRHSYSHLRKVFGRLGIKASDSKISHGYRRLVDLGLMTGAGYGAYRLQGPVPVAQYLAAASSFDASLNKQLTHVHVHQGLVTECPSLFAATKQCVADWSALLDEAGSPYLLQVALQAFWEIDRSRLTNPGGYLRQVVRYLAGQRTRLPQDIRGQIDKMQEAMVAQAPDITASSTALASNHSYCSIASLLWKET